MDKIMVWKYRFAKYSEELDGQLLNDIHSEMKDVKIYWSHKELLIGDELFQDAGEHHPIKIDDMITILNELKEKGCNYVEIVYNPDVYRYNLIGVGIQKASAADVEEYERKSRESLSAWRKRRINELENELTILKTEEEKI